MEENKKHVLLTTDSGLTYEDYLDWCRDNDIDEPGDIESQGFYDWYTTTSDDYTEDEWRDLEHLLDGTSCIVTGVLGLWNGNPTIEPFIMDSVFEAVRKCVSGSSALDYELSYEDGDDCFRLSCAHHDGTNHFDIYPLTSDGLEAAKDALYDHEFGEDFDVVDEWVRRLNWPPDFMY